MGMNHRLLRPTQSGFNPNSISGLVYWWDASDASTLTLNTSNNPATVSQWTSKASAKTAATQTTSNNQPTTTTVNGRTAILFDGSNDGFDFTGASRTDETWVIAAAQTVDQTGTRSFVTDAGAGYGINSVRGAVRQLQVAFGTSNGFTEGTDQLRVTYSSNPATPIGPNIISVVRSAAAGGTVFIDGTQRISGVNGSSSWSTPGPVTIQRIGYYNSTTFQLQGWIGEILCYSRALTDTERQRCERALGKKWGITVA